MLCGTNHHYYDLMIKMMLELVLEIPYFLNVVKQGVVALTQTTPHLEQKNVS